MTFAYKTGTDLAPKMTIDHSDLEITFINWVKNQLPVNLINTGIPRLYQLWDINQRTSGPVSLKTLFQLKLILHVTGQTIYQGV